VFGASFSRRLHAGSAVHLPRHSQHHEEKNLACEIVYIALNVQQKLKLRLLSRGISRRIQIRSANGVIAEAIWSIGLYVRTY
jgi:hypothetical protein